MGRNTRPPGQSTTEPEALTFEAIYDNHTRWVWRMVRRFGVPEGWCEDAMQEVFVVVLRRLPEYKGQHLLRGWLGTISAKVAANFRRREAKIPIAESIIEAEGSHPAAVVAPVDLEREIASTDELQRMLDELDPDQRLLLLLHHGDGVPIDELAEHLSVPEGTIKSRLARAREAFEAAWKRLQVREGRAGANVLPLFGPWARLEADRHAPPLPDGVKERVWDNLQRIRAGGNGGGNRTGSGGGSPPSARLARLASTVAGVLSTKVTITMAVTVGTLVAIVAAGAFAAGVVVGVAWKRAPAVAPSEPQIVATVPAPLAPTAVTAAPSAASSATAPAPSATAPATAASIAPSAGIAADLENVWMVKARSALAGGNIAAALAALQEHATRYHGGGQRAQERESLWIGTLLRAGRIGEARARFETFERLYPQSPRVPEFREALTAP
jgi:RNA polymerase sigma-70 factor, ECF subfamily